MTTYTIEDVPTQTVSDGVRRDLSDAERQQILQEWKIEETRLAALPLAYLRRERNKRLAETDWWAYQDTPDMTQAQSDYRQALRDITNTYTSLDDVVWPSKP